MRKENMVDEAFLPFSELVEQLSDLEGRIVDTEEEELIKMEIEKVKLGLPVQLEIDIDEKGQVSLGGVPPLYYVETTFMPVFHQLNLTLEPHREENNGAK